MGRLIWPILLAACASYRALPLAAPPPPGPSPFPLRYAQTRLHLFTSTRDDARIEAIFASGAGIVAVVSQPREGVFVSTDGGADWTFAPVDDRFRDVMFDGTLIVGRGTAHIQCSGDGGKTWRAWGDMPIDAAVAAQGVIYAAAGSHLYLSEDCAQSWKTLTPQIPGAWRARSIAADRRSLYLSVSAARETPPLTSLLDGSSEAARAALSLVDGGDWKGSEPEGVWVSHDGGALWKRTPLALDGWLVARDGEIWAVAADPMIEGAALVRRAPLLAAALDAQLRGARIDAGALRASCEFPGRDELLRAIRAPVFRSADEGMTWSRTHDAPLFLRVALERQRAARPATQRAPQPARRAPSGAGRAGGDGPAGGRHGSRSGRRGSRSPPQEPRPRLPAVSSESFFTLLDPVRLLARFNSGRALTGVAGEGVLYAYAPRREFWDSLVAALASASDAEGEIAPGPGRPGPGSAVDGAFELLLSSDGGTSWSDLPLPRFDPALRERGILPYPADVAASRRQGFVLFAATEQGGDAWRETWRWPL